MSGLEGPANQISSDNGKGVPPPDATISKLEDDLVKNLNSNSLTAKMAAMDLSKEPFPTRPAYGTRGTEVVLWANSFALQIKSKPLCHYGLKVERVTPEDSKDKTPEASTVRPPKTGSKDKAKLPEIKGQKLARLVELALQKIGGSVKAVTEFKSQVVTPEPLSFPGGDQTVEVIYTDEGRETPFKVKFDGPQHIDIGDLVAYLSTMKKVDDAFPVFESVVSAIGVVVGHTPRSNPQIASLGSSRHFPLDKPTEMQILGMPDLNTVIRGYFASVRPATGRLLLNANVSHGVFRFSGEVTDFIRNGNFNLNDPRSMQSLNKALGRLRAEVKFIIEQPEAKGKAQLPRFKVSQKTICGLASPKDGRKNSMKKPTLGATPAQIFFTLDGNKPVPAGFQAGKQYSVAQYFKQRYGYDVQPNLPAINTGTLLAPIYMPAELVKVVAGQALRRRTTPGETDEMIRFACRSPFANATSINGMGRQILSLDGNDTLKDFGITVGGKMLTVRGRELVPPQIVYNNLQGRPINIAARDGGWNMRDVKVCKPGYLIKNWTWLNIDPYADKSSTTAALEGWVAFMRTMGISITSYKDLKPESLKNGFEAYTDRNRSYYDAIREAMKAIPDNMQFVFVVLPRKDTDIYNAVKRVADVDRGFHTVCVVRKNLEKQQPQYFANVGLKVNLKAGGANHRLKDSVPLLKEGKTMVVGYDVTHPTNLSGGSGELPSLVGMVSSIDNDLGQWLPASWSQASLQEMLDKELKAAFKERLSLWRGKNSGKLPENLVVYRDGVSEGQFSQVLKDELPKMRDACTELYPANEKPNISIIVSVKRHQTRFYPTDEKHMTSSRNIRSGTVVDRGVTLTKTWDFFLTAHQALQGTARPAHYTVLLDEVFRAKFKAEAANELQKLTHEMCYVSCHQTSSRYFPGLGPRGLTGNAVVRPRYQGRQYLPAGLLCRHPLYAAACVHVGCVRPVRQPI